MLDVLAGHKVLSYIPVFKISEIMILLAGNSSPKVLQRALLAAGAVELTCCQIYSRPLIQIIGALMVHQLLLLVLILFTVPPEHLLIVWLAGLVHHLAMITMLK